MKKYAKFGAPLLAIAVLAGCVGTGTITFKYEIDEFYSSGDYIEIREIDLTDNSDYNDNKDKIKSIDQVTVLGWIFNEEPVANQAEIWLSESELYPDADSVREYATRVFSVPAVPGNDSVFIDWENGLDHLENIPVLKDAADAGYFWLYGLAQNSPFAFRFRIGLVITMTVGA
jgi:hypothetical protein